MYHIQYGTKQIKFSIDNRKRKSIAVEVHPDTSVQIKAPIDCHLDDIKRVVSKRSKWIITQQKFFEQFLPETPKREYVQGETHCYLGRKYILKIIISSEDKVKLQGGFLLIYSTDSSEEKIKHLLTQWYFKRASKVFKKLYDEAFQKFNHFSIQKPEMQIKRMKKRWGSYSPRGTIFVNPELIKTATVCIEYVFIHELCHLLERNHSAKFYHLLTNVLPNWERWKLKLEKTL